MNTDPPNPKLAAPAVSTEENDPDYQDSLFRELMDSLDINCEQGLELLNLNAIRAHGYPVGDFNRNASVGQKVREGGKKGSDLAPRLNHSEMQRRCDELREEHSSWPKSQIHEKVGKEFSCNEKTVRRNCEVKPRLK